MLNSKSKTQKIMKLSGSGLYRRNLSKKKAILIPAFEGPDKRTSPAAIATDRRNSGRPFATDRRAANSSRYVDRGLAA